MFKLEKFPISSNVLNKLNLFQHIRLVDERPKNSFKLYV